MDRDRFQSALLRVRSGEITPADAAQLLVADEASCGLLSQRSDPLAVVVGRLGPPPVDILDQWRIQLLQIACHHQQVTHSDLPELDLTDVALTASGTLTWRQYWASPGSEIVGHPTQQSIRQVNQLLSSLASCQAADPNPQSVDSAPIGRPGRSAAQARSLTPGRRRAVTIFAAMCCLVILCIPLSHSVVPEKVVAEKVVAEKVAPEKKDPDLRNSEHAAASPQPELDSERPQQDSVDTGRIAGGGELVTIAAVSDDRSRTTDGYSTMPTQHSESTQLNTPSTGLDSVSESAAVPPVESPAESPAESPVESPVEPPVEPPVVASSKVETEELKLAEVPNRPSAESAELTSEPAAQSVNLGGPPAETSTARLCDRPLVAATLEFPFGDAPLQMQQTEKGSWAIEDRRHGTPIAHITSDANGTELSWTDLAAQSSSARSLVHGRIRDSGGAKIYLRPDRRTRPWNLDFTQPDLTQTWDLQYGLPPRGARIAIGFDLPKGIAIQWIEPIDGNAAGRGHGLGVLTLGDSETVAVAVRFDYRCSRKLSCRVRFAGRVDPSSPWQTVSTPMLEQIADQLAQKALHVSAESVRLSRLYQLARSDGRRLLRFKRRRNEQLAEHVRESSQRLTQLRSLIATLETEGTVNIRLWIEWPNDQQTILAVSDH